jgi:hypothetical protein
METIQLLAATLLGPGLFAAVLLPALAHLNRSIEMEKNCGNSSGGTPGKN